MLLTIDIGNTCISFGSFCDDKLLFVSDILTDIYKSADQYAIDFLQIFALYGIDKEKIDCGIISSVVPELTDVIKTAVNRICNIISYVLGPGIKTGLKINIDNPAQLGADTVACAVSVINKYKDPALICDFGTATVFSMIDENSSLNGVIIAAGVGTTLDAFTKKTALLPHVSIDAPKNLLGTNTCSSIQSGLIFGTASMVDGIIERLKKETSNDLKVIATGMYANKIVPYCNHEIELSEHLIFDGLKIIYEKNKK